MRGHLGRVNGVSRQGAREIHRTGWAEAAHCRSKESGQGSKRSRQSKMLKDWV